jgi:hypothetical protein
MPESVTSVPFGNTPATIGNTALPKVTVCARQPSRSKNRANDRSSANPAVARTVPTGGGNETHSHLGRPRSPTRTTL